ncbi:hypothetical protein F8388_023691 [Cannabis sativa]|uniref:Uncharacterized protein n=1 Tax=Cannabis sativa TaxID=3483 RepID=A0A7J6G9R1_CANSA|nr:hypothetical protein F8388_023691 [Cannabis sativa]
MRISNVHGELINSLEPCPGKLSVGIWVFLEHHFSCWIDCLLYGGEDSGARCDIVATNTLPFNGPTTTLITQIVCMSTCNQNLRRFLWKRLKGLHFHTLSLAIFSTRTTSKQ